MYKGRGEGDAKIEEKEEKGGKGKQWAWSECDYSGIYLIIIILVYHWSLKPEIRKPYYYLRMHSAILKKIQASLTSVARESISKDQLDFIDHPFE